MLDSESEILESKGSIDDWCDEKGSKGLSALR